MWDRVDVKIYQAIKMTGRTAKAVVDQATKARRVFQAYGITVFDPVQEEGVKPVAKAVISQDTAEQQADLQRYWARDKQMIRSAHVLVDISPELKSEGVSHEIGYARYGLWKPVVRVYHGRPPYGIATLEDDLLVSSVAEAAEQIRIRWGTRHKRIVWRLKLLRTKLLKFLKYQLQEFK